MADSNVVAEINSNVKRLSNLESVLERAISRAERSRNSAQIAAQARTGFFHRREAIESLQQAVSDMADSGSETVNLVQSVVRSMQAIAQISDSIIKLGAANLQQNRAVIARLKELLEGDGSGNLDEATQDEIKSILEELNRRQDIFIRQDNTDSTLREHEQRFDDLEERFDALQNGKILNGKPLINVWTSSDFESKNDFFEKLETKQVKKGDHFKGTVSKVIDSGAFIYISEDPSSNRHFDGFLPVGEIDWNRHNSAADVISEGEEIEVQITRIDYDNQRVTVSRKPLLTREHEDENQNNSGENIIFEPIDNSDVEVEEGNRLYIHPINTENPHLQKIVPIFNASINDLEHSLGEIQGTSKYEKAQNLINGVFISGFDSKIYISNRSFPRQDGSPSKKIAIRTPRVPGDWLETNLKLPVSKTLIFEGNPYNWGKELSIDNIFLNAESTERLPYEVECSVRICDSSATIRRGFLDDIINKTTSVHEHTAQQLTLWEDYLDWSKKIAEHQIKGCKYIDLNYDSERQKLVFTLIAKSKDDFDKVRKALRRDVQAYKNNYSSGEWEFIYDNSARGYGEPIGLCDKNVVDEFNLYGNEQRLGYHGNSITVDDIHTAFGEESPYIIKMSYDFSADDKDYIQEQNLENESLDNYVRDEVIPRYPENGFLALSAVGDFSLIWRFNNAIKQLKEGENYSPRLAEWIFDSKYARLPDKAINDDEIVWSNSSIESNSFQKEAVIKMLQAPDLFLLQGPPGTGKTTVIAEAIYQFVRQGKRVLLSSQSNDAVDNALERLANTPEIRALRIGGKKKKTKNADEELALNKFSEETALKYYYKSISSQISERMLDKWSDLSNLETEYKTDKRDLRNFNKDITDLQSSKREKLREGTNLRNQLSDAKADLEEYNRKTSDIQNENKQFNLFLNILNQDSDVQFAFSKDQIQLIKNDFNKLNTQLKETGINIVSGKGIISENSLRESNSILFSFCFNLNTLKELNEKLSKVSLSKKDEVSPEILILNKKIAELEERLATCSDEEYDKLEYEQNELKRQKKRLNSGNNSGIELSSVEKSLCNESNILLLQNNPEELKRIINEAIERCRDVIKSMRNKLENRIVENNKRFDSTPFNNSIDSLEGKIRINDSEIETIDNSILRKQNTVVNMCRKYGLVETSTIEQIEEKINELIGTNKKAQEDAKEIKNYWGSILTEFKQKLDKHSSDDRLIQIDNDNYFKTVYVKACNVVGISCTANPKILAEKDYNDFDVVIIDEVSKATPPELLIPLMKARKTVLVGDHRQLPPMFKENIGSYSEFVEEVQNSDDYDDDLKDIVTIENFIKYKNMVTASLFKDHFEHAPDALKSSLLIQFRMHPDIMNIINRFYEGKLQCGIPKDKVELGKYTDENGKELSGKAHNLRIQSVKKMDFIVPRKHAYWIDSSKLPNGEEVVETHKGTSTSSCNYLEEDMAIELVKKIAATYKNQGYPKISTDKSGEQRKETVSIGIISFYQMQVNDIRRKIKALRKKVDLSAVDIDVNTVDRFQGKEKQIVIVSLVRNKKFDARRGLRVSDHVLSFERINVAFSRAQNMLVILGAKNFYNAIEVKLPAMNSVGTRSTFVYQNIMQDLQDKGCFFDSSVLIDDEQTKMIIDEINKSREDSGEQKKRSNNYRGGRR